MAAAAGGTVISISSSDEKLKVARRLGARHVVNYSTNADWASEVLKLTGGKGVDLVLDVVGAQTMEQTGESEHSPVSDIELINRFRRIVKATAFKGMIVVVGMLSKDPLQPVNILSDVLFKAITSKPIVLPCGRYRC